MDRALYHYTPLATILQVTLPQHIAFEICTTVIDVSSVLLGQCSVDTVSFWVALSYGKPTFHLLIDFNTCLTQAQYAIQGSLYTPFKAHLIIYGVQGSLYTSFKAHDFCRLRLIIYAVQGTILQAHYRSLFYKF